MNTILFLSDLIGLSYLFFFYDIRCVCNLKMRSGNRWYLWYTLGISIFVIDHACASTYDLTAVESIPFFHCLFMTFVRFWAVDY